MTDSFARRFNFDVRNKEITAFATLHATDVGQVAYEYKEKKQGYFTWTLVEGLKGGAANEKGEVTLGGLVRYLQEQVPKRVRLDMGQEKSQRPYATVGGYKADELVISITVRVPPVTPVVSAIDPAVIELEFWNSTKNSSDVDDFKEYLAKYPNGAFAGLARNKIRALDAAAKSNAAPPKSEPKPTALEPKTVSSGGTATPRAGPGGLPLRGFEFEVVTVNSSGSATSRRKQQGQYWSEVIAGISLELVPIPGGTFMMGSSSGELNRTSDEGPQHQVTLGAFYMGKYEVTQSQWRAVAGLPKVARDLHSDPSQFKGDNLPVEQVSWDEAREFCARLARATGRSYRLPTEAEWEYACRAGTTTPFVFGETVTPQLVNYNGNLPYAQAPKGANRETTTPVGSMGVANGFGLFDMHGNVLEWCQDYWHESYYGAASDGRSWETAGAKGYRVLRGGSWFNAAHYARSAYRNWFTPDSRFSSFGFRVVVGARTP